ncbi:MAG: AAA family ATPase [Candidatus Nanoarchaeia archaeon]
MKPKRIFILGTVGCGKSTFAKKLSAMLKIKHYDLDDVFWTSKFNKKRTEKERDKKFKSLCDKKEWIVEGVYSTWIEYGIKKADVVVLLKIPRLILFWRITKRVVRREKQKQLGKERYRQSFRDYIGLLKAVMRYYSKASERGYYKHKELVDKNKAKFVILKTNKDIDNFFKDIKHS